MERIVSPCMEASVDAKIKFGERVTGSIMVAGGLDFKHPSFPIKGLTASLLINLGATNKGRVDRMIPFLIRHVL